MWFLLPRLEVQELYTWSQTLNLHVNLLCAGAEINGSQRSLSGRGRNIELMLYFESFFTVFPLFSTLVCGISIIYLEKFV